LVLQLSFRNCCTSDVATACFGCCNHLSFFHKVATTSSKHQPSCNLTASWHGAFFLELFFFLQSWHISGCNHTVTY
jgi:hypothetical protein